MNSTILSSRKPGYAIALFATAFAFVVIGLGAFTRLVDAGLGCPDWPGCYGHILWPQTESDVVAAEQLYPEAPVEHDKTWPEMVHRYLAASLGLFAIALLVICARNRTKAQPFKHAVFLLALVIVQGMFGMWTVTLKLWPQVVTAHLLGGFLTAATLWLLCLRLSGKIWRTAGPGKRKLRKLYPFAVLTAFVLLLQIALGGWTTSNYAAVACPDFPMCQQQWVPDMNLAEGFNVLQSIGPNYLGGTMDNDARVAIHFSHRIGAIVASLFILIVVIRLFFASSMMAARRLSVVLLAVLLVQIGLGISNVVLHFPVAVAVAHNACGALLLLCMVTVLHRLFSVEILR